MIIFSLTGKWPFPTIFQINTDLLVSYQNIKIFTKEALYLSLILKKFGTLHCKVFSKHPPFSIFFTIFNSQWSEIFSNKHWLPYRSAKNVYLTPFLHLIKTIASMIFLGISTFYHILTSFHEVCNISNKYWPPYKLAKCWYFLHKKPYSPRPFQKNWHSPSQNLLLF